MEINDHRPILFSRLFYAMMDAVYRDTLYGIVKVSTGVLQMEKLSVATR